MWLRILTAIIALLVSLPNSAKADVCDQFAGPVDAFELDAIAEEVRDGLPTMYRHILDRVEVETSDESGYQTYFENSPNGGVITVPNYMPKYVCRLLAIALVVEGANETPLSVAQLAKINSTQNPCDAGQASDSCLLPMLDVLYVLLQPQLATAPQNYSAVLPFLTRESLKIALAHEYGHAIIENGYSDERRGSLTDHELEADLLALHPQVSQRAPKAASTLMYAAMVLVERINRQSRVQSGVHDLTACRLLRLQAIQRATMPGIDALSLWKPGTPLPAIEPAAGLLSSKLEEADQCTIELPEEIAAFRSDLSSIHGIVAAMPAKEPAAGSFAALEAFKAKTLLGESVRNQMLFRGAMAIPVPPLFETKDAAQRELALAQLVIKRTELDRVVTDPLPAASTRDFVNEYALTLFMQGPPGTRIKSAARELADSLSAFDAFMTGTPRWQSQRAIALVLAGDCFAAAESAVMARYNLHRITLQLGSLVQVWNIPVESFPQLLVPLADHFEAAKRGETKFDPRHCESIRGPLVVFLRERLGWVD